MGVHFVSCWVCSFSACSGRQVVANSILLRQVDAAVRAAHLPVCELVAEDGVGPMWSTIADHQQQSCGKYWFSNLLYFNNLYPDVMGDEVSAVADRLRFLPVFFGWLFRIPTLRGIGYCYWIKIWFWVGVFRSKFLIDYFRRQACVST